MTRFSERFGHSPPKTEIAEDQMPNTLRSGLWDCVTEIYFQSIARFDAIGRLKGYEDEFANITYYVWFNFFRKPTDSRPSDPRKALNELREEFFKGNFYQVYDLLEFLVQSPYGGYGGGEKCCEMCNKIFARELAAFRFADTTLVKISNEVERSEIEKSMVQNPATSVQIHIKRAAELFSQRPEPDFRNSIKESISAVEAAVSFVLERKTYGIAKPLKSAADQFGLHPALRDGFEKLYAFTSDAEGIRHALLDEKGLSQEDARYMLVSCSAFANYLVAIKAKAK